MKNGLRCDDVVEPNDAISIINFCVDLLTIAKEQFTLFILFCCAHLLLSFSIVNERSSSEYNGGTKIKKLMHNDRQMVQIAEIVRKSSEKKQQKNAHNT